MLIPFTIHKKLKEDQAGLTIDETAIMLGEVIQREDHAMDLYKEFVSVIKETRGRFSDGIFQLDGGVTLALWLKGDQDALRFWKVTSGKEPPPKPPLPHEYPALILAELKAMNSRLANVEQTLHNIETNTYSG